VRVALRAAMATLTIFVLGWSTAPTAAAAITKSERAALDGIGKKKPATAKSATNPAAKPSATNPAAKPSATNPAAKPSATNPAAKPSAGKSPAKPSAAGLSSEELRALSSISSAAGAETEPAPPRASARPASPQARPGEPTPPRTGREALARQNAAQAQLLVVHARRIEQIVQRVGMDPTRLLNHPINRAGAQGGPFIPLPRDAAAGARAGHSPLVGGLVSRPERLRHLVAHLPLSTPVHNHTLSSGFGPRRDPFTGSWAFHSGLDMPAPIDTPVHVAGPGVVIFADWQDNYGRIVEVEHEYGIRTRYAHLNRIAVRRGQRLRSGQYVGGIGSTGRSTGPHLHYEVLLDGRAVDPLPFVEIGRDLRN